MQADNTYRVDRQMAHCKLCLGKSLHLRLPRTKVFLERSNLFVVTLYGDVTAELSVAVTSVRL